MVDKATNPAVVLDEDDDLDLWNAGPPRRAPAPPPPDSTSSDEYSDNESAAGRARQAAAKLQNHNASIAPTIALPSVNDAFTAVEGPPAFLDPEATRQIPEVPRHGNTNNSRLHLSSISSIDQEWDISRMAPKLKGVDDDQPQPGVISAAAKRFKADDGGEAVAVFSSAAQVPMLGGLPQHHEGKDEGNKRASKAMGVEEFLDKGGAQLPRKRQDRKEKEKEKRGKGQSTHSSWKSETEMALRQQYD